MKLLLATEEQGDKYCDEVRDWYYDPTVSESPCSIFSSRSSLFVVAEFIANKDGITLYESRAE
jgi:hypothetical protein